MRPLQHPKLDEITVEAILHAFSSPVRVQIFAQIKASEQAQNCSKFLTINNQKLPKSTLSQHFKILREAGLIASERVGVELHNRTRCKELHDRYGDMIRCILDSYAEQTARRKTRRAHSA